MFLGKCAFLLFITSAFCQDPKRLNVLHLGEEKDDIPNNYISKGVDDLMEDKEMTEYEIQLTTINLKDIVRIDQVCGKIAELNNGSLTQDLIIDTTKKPQLREITAKIAKNYGIPVIFVTSINDNTKIDLSREQYVLRFSPPNHDFHLIVRELVLKKKMTDFVVIYDKDVEYRWKELRDELKPLNIPCLFTPPFFLRSQYRVLSTINSMYFRNIISFGGWPGNKTRLNKGQAVYLIHENKPVSNPINADNIEVDLTPKLKHRKAKDAIAGEKRALTAAFYYELTLVGVRALREMKKAYPDAEEHNDCSSPGNTKASSYRKYFEEQNAREGNDISFVKTNDSYLAFEMEVLHKGVTVANYEIRKEVRVLLKDAWENIQPRRHYTVLAKVKPPFVYSWNGSHSGYLIEMLEMIASIQNFTYELTVLPDNQSYTSAIFIKKMLQGKFDIGLGPVFETTINDNYMVSFSIPYYRMVGIKFLMKNTKDDSIFTFITVLEPIVWGCILSAFFMNSFLLWASERFSPYSYRNNKEKYVDDEEVRDFTAKESLWFCLTSITPEGGGIVPKHISGRLIVVTWWLFGFIILASYTANLAAFLTLSKMKNPIQNFDDLHRQFKMRYAPLRGSDEMSYIEAMYKGETTNRANAPPRWVKYALDIKGFGLNLVPQAMKIVPVPSDDESGSATGINVFSGQEYPMPNKFNRITMIINMTGPPNDTETALQMIYASETATEGFAFIVDSADARYLLMTRCKLIDVEEEAAKRNLVIVTPQVNTILKYDIDYAITLIQKRQWEMELEKKWWDNNPYKSTNCTELEDDAEGIGIYNIGGVFLMIFVGIGISMITMAYDYMTYRYRIEGTVTPLTFEKTATTPELPLELESTIPEKKEEDDEGSTRLQRRNIAKY